MLSVYFIAVPPSFRKDAMLNELAACIDQICTCDYRYHSFNPKTTSYLLYAKSLQGRCVPTTIMPSQRHEQFCHSQYILNVLELYLLHTSISITSKSYEDVGKKSSGFAALFLPSLKVSITCYTVPPMFGQNINRA